ncbi:hypothetical protein BX666DRAFT_1963791 [Dichotomocladium elegans]|nr:hypothetical protein BX666DRAFT_1963791 [Dichotomocladium elegans]
MYRNILLLNSVIFFLSSASYWDKDITQWEMTDFDFEFLKKNPSASKAFAHRELAAQIKLMLERNEGNNFVLSKLKRLKNQLARSHKDVVNRNFWSTQRDKVGLAAVEEKVAGFQTQAGFSTFLADAIQRRARELKAICPTKRGHDSGEEESDPSISSGEYRSRQKKKRKRSETDDPEVSDNYGVRCERAVVAVKSVLSESSGC